jgi:hypothetical protein
MNLETFFTILYTLVDDWYQQYVAPYKPKRGGPAARMSDSEVLTVMLAAQWQAGPPWRSERGMVRYLHAHCLDLFPTMLQRSAFNERARRLWGAFILLQQVVATLLDDTDAIFECVDCAPVPAFSNGQALRDPGHWLWESTTGRGGTSGGYFVGDHVLLSVSRSGAITGWLLGTAYIQDRWLLEALLSARAGQPQLVAPERPPSKESVFPPVGHIGPLQAAGTWTARSYLADQGFNGDRWQEHWQQNYGATVITAPPANTRRAWSWQWKRWLASLRQLVDTTFAFLVDYFGLQHVNAHSRWGQYTRVAAKMAAYNIGLFINRMLSRPLHAFGTLII